MLGGLSLSCLATKALRISGSCVCGGLVMHGCEHEEGVCETHCVCGASHCTVCVKHNVGTWGSLASKHGQSAKSCQRNRASPLPSVPPRLSMHLYSVPVRAAGTPAVVSAPLPERGLADRKWTQNVETGQKASCGRVCRLFLWISSYF